MPAVSCRCRFPSFLYRVYQPTRRRAEASPRACVALCGVLRAREAMGPITSRSPPGHGAKCLGANAGAGCARRGEGE
jgi:hypothetical protein